jgi:hypothetical protein
MEKFLDPETKTPMIRDESRDVKHSQKHFLEYLGVPSGFKRIMWWDVEENHQVYIWGSHLKIEGSYQPRAYGPHWVYNKEKRQLHNRANVVFMHYPNELLVRA